MEKLYTRKELINKTGIAILGGLGLQSLTKSPIYAQSYTPREEAWYSDPKAFWETVDPKIERILEVASSKFSPDQNQDLKIYTPFYLAGEIKFEVPWLLLWIIHEEETTTSRDKNPDRSGYFGAMQRDNSFWPDRDAEKAIADMPFLKTLPQRYPSDAREILWASSFIRAHANRIQAKYPQQSDEECVLNSLFNYCAESHAKSRINKFNKRKSLFYE